MIKGLVIFMAVVSFCTIASAQKALTNDVKQISISGNRIGVLKSNGEVHVKEGGLGTDWTNVTQNKGGNLPKMKKIALYGKRILALTESGEVFGTSPDNFATWNGIWTSVLADKVIDIAVTDNRILILQNNGQVFVKEGDWGAGWTNITQNIGGNLPKMKKIAMSGKRILALTESGEVFGTSPDNFATWNGIWTSKLTDNLIDIAVTDNRVVVLQNIGNVIVKEGDWGAGWY